MSSTLIFDKPRVFHDIAPQAEDGLVVQTGLDAKVKGFWVGVLLCFLHVVECDLFEVGMNQGVDRRDYL